MPRLRICTVNSTELDRGQTYMYFSWDGVTRLPYARCHARARAARAAIQAEASGRFSTNFCRDRFTSGVDGRREGRNDVMLAVFIMLQLRRS